MKIPFAPACVVWRETRDRRLGIKLRFSNYGSVTTLQQPRPSNYASATAAQQPNYPLASTTTLQQLRFNNQNPLSLQQPNLSNQNSPPPWRVHASYHNPTPLASTCEDCEVTSYTINIRPPLATSASGRRRWPQCPVRLVLDLWFPEWQVVTGGIRNALLGNRTPFQKFHVTASPRRSEIRPWTSFDHWIDRYLG